MWETRCSYHKCYFYAASSNLEVRYQLSVIQDHILIIDKLSRLRPANSSRLQKRTIDAEVERCVADERIGQFIRNGIPQTAVGDPDFTHDFTYESAIKQATFPIFTFAEIKRGDVRQIGLSVARDSSDHPFKHVRNVA